MAQPRKVLSKEFNLDLPASRALKLKTLGSDRLLIAAGSKIHFFSLKTKILLPTSLETQQTINCLDKHQYTVFAAHGFATKSTSMASFNLRTSESKETPCPPFFCNFKILDSNPNAPLVVMVAEEKVQQPSRVMDDADVTSIDSVDAKDLGSAAARNITPGSEIVVANAHTMTKVASVPSSIPFKIESTIPIATMGSYVIVAEPRKYALFHFGGATIQKVKEVNCYGISTIANFSDAYFIAASNHGSVALCNKILTSIRATIAPSGIIRSVASFAEKFVFAISERTEQAGATFQSYYTLHLARLENSKLISCNDHKLNTTKKPTLEVLDSGAIALACEGEIQSHLQLLLFPEITDYLSKLGLWFEAARIQLAPVGIPLPVLNEIFAYLKEFYHCQSYQALMSYGIFASTNSSMPEADGPKLFPKNPFV